MGAWMLECIQVVLYMPRLFEENKNEIEIIKMYNSCTSTQHSKSSPLPSNYGIHCHIHIFVQMDENIYSDIFQKSSLCTYLDNPKHKLKLGTFKSF